MSRIRAGSGYPFERTPIPTHVRLARATTCSFRAWPRGRPTWRVTRRMILPITHGPCLWPALIMTVRRSSTRRSTAPSLSANRRSNVQQKSEGETLSMHALRFRQSHLGGYGATEPRGCCLVSKAATIRRPGSKGLASSCWNHRCSPPVRSYRPPVERSRPGKKLHRLRMPRRITAEHHLIWVLATLAKRPAEMQRRNRRKPSS